MCSVCFLLLRSYVSLGIQSFVPSSSCVLKALPIAYFWALVLVPIYYTDTRTYRLWSSIFPAAYKLVLQSRLPFISIMTASIALQRVLNDAISAGHEIESELHKERNCSNGTSQDVSTTHWEFELPARLEGARKRLANAAAQLLQLATDPKEYLEQLSANVSAPRKPSTIRHH